MDRGEEGYGETQQMHQRITFTKAVNTYGDHHKVLGCRFIVNQSTNGLFMLDVDLYTHSTIQKDI